MKILFTIALLVLLHGPARAQHKHDRPRDPAMHEGAISITGEGFAENMTVLGGQIGKETVDGVHVGLFVLQAESPDRLRPGAEGPTHLFNVTFLEEGKPGFVREVRGAIVVEGPGEPQRIDFRPHEAHHQAATRLELEGEYRIRVEFEAGESRGRTAAFPFLYRTKKHAAHH